MPLTSRPFSFVCNLVIMSSIFERNIYLIISLHHVIVVNVYGVMLFNQIDAQMLRVPGDNRIIQCTTTTSSCRSDNYISC